MKSWIEFAGNRLFSVSATWQRLLEKRSVWDSEPAQPRPGSVPAAAGLCVCWWCCSLCMWTSGPAHVVVLTGQFLRIGLSCVDGLQQQSAVSGPAGSSRRSPETGRDLRVQSLWGLSVLLSLHWLSPVCLFGHVSFSFSFRLISVVLFCIS